MIDEIAAILAAGGFVAVAAFQLLLASGRPWGKYAWGGYHEVLPTKLRLASTASMLIFLLAALIILDRVNLIDVYSDEGFISQAAWALAGWLGIGVLMNAASKSQSERKLMTPIAMVLALLSFTVALTA